jgi:predicted transcriptional regulator
MAKRTTCHGSYSHIAGGEGPLTLLSAARRQQRQRDDNLQALSHCEALQTRGVLSRPQSLSDHCVRIGGTPSRHFTDFPSRVCSALADTRVARGRARRAHLGEGGQRSSSRELNLVFENCQPVLVGVTMVTPVRSTQLNMSETTTTTLKLPPKLKQRLTALAEQSGKSAHGLMIEAIERHIEYEERMRAFVAEAIEADRDIERTGEIYAAEDVHAWLERLAQGKKTRRPKPWRR